METQVQEWRYVSTFRNLNLLVIITCVQFAFDMLKNK